MAKQVPLSRRDFLISAGAGIAGMGLLGTLAKAAASAGPPAKRPPNIIVILADDLGYGDVGFNGCKDIPTPNIDALAAGGVRFSQGYVTAPLCSPTRCGLMLGRYQQRIGWEFNPNRGDPGLPVEEKIFADYMKQAGYATALVGKWHLGYAQPYLPLQRGFDEFYGFTYAMNPYLGVDGKPNMLWRGNEQVEEKEYLTDAFTREACEYIGRKKDKPFFLYLAYNAVHMPLDACPRYKDKFSEIADPKRRALATMLAALDDGVGSVMKKLRDEKLDQDTLVFFFSDNGAPTALNASSNAPFSGGKNTLMEGGIHMPWLMHWTGRLPAGKVVDQPVISLDILTTSLAAAGAKAPQGARLEGVDLLPYIDGKTSGAPHDCLYWRFGAQWAVRSGDFKLRVYEKDEAPKLFDLSKDVAEQNDLAAKHPDKVKQLTDAYNKWNASNKEAIYKTQKKPASQARQSRPASAASQSLPAE